MTDVKASTAKPKPAWKRHHTVASIILVAGIFATAVVGAASGSTITRAVNQKLDVQQIVAAADVSYLLTKDGKLYSQGLNNFGQLGIGSFVNAPDWTQVNFAVEGEQPAITKLSTQGEHVLALDASGGLWTWGNASDGALGNGSENPVLQPSKLAVSYSFTQIEAGDDFVVAIDSRGSLYTWGQNSQGQLGNDTTQAVSGPAILELGVRFTSVTAGKNFALAIDETGALWAWGANDAGQYGNGSKDVSLVPVKVSDKAWQSVTASRFSNTVMGIDTDGKLWSWGSGAHALLGTGSDWRAEQAAENKRVADEIARIKVADAAARQAIVDELNKARIAELHAEWATKDTAWKAANPAPKLTDFPTPPVTPTPTPTPAPTPTPSPTPTPAPEPYDNAAYQKALEAWNKSRATWLQANPEPVNADALTAADKATIEAAVVARWEETDTSKIVPAKIPEPEIPTESLTPVRVPSVVNFRTVSIGSENAFALDVLGRLWAWGNDKNGQTGLSIDEETHTHLPLKVSEASYSDVFAGDKWASVAGSGLYTWGLNSDANQLQSDKSKLASPTLIREGEFASLAGSTATGAATQADGATITWGSNAAGIAGRNAKDPNVGVDLIEGRYGKVSFAANGVIALGTGPGNLYFWGSDKDEISAATTPFKENVLAPQRHSISNFIDVAAGRLSSHAVDANGFVWTWGLSWMGAISYPAKVIGQPTQVPVGAKVTKIAASQTDVLLLTDKNELRWWGAHSEGGQITAASIPEGTTLGAVTAIESGKDHFVILDENGDVFSLSSDWGLAQIENQTPNALTKVKLPAAAQSIAAGGLGSIAVVDGVAYGWGDNESRQIEPTGEERYILNPVELPAPYEGGWSEIGLSNTHMLGVSDKGVLYGWGHSKYIQGLGTAQPSKPIHFSINVESE